MNVARAVCLLILLFNSSAFTQTVPAPREVTVKAPDGVELKATYYATQLGVWAMADDSGLEVDALNRAPGVHSARGAQLNNTGRGDADNNWLLLRQLGEVPDAERSARRLWPAVWVL